MSIELITSREARAAGRSEELVLLEQIPDFYTEFMAFLAPQTTRGGGSLFFRGPSGRVYRLGDAAGRTKGMAIYVQTESGATIDKDEVDRDLWSFLEWLLAGVGGEWSAEALLKTGAIYKVPGAPEKA